MLGRGSPERLWHLGNILKPSHCGTGQLTQETRGSLEKATHYQHSFIQLFIAYFVEAKVPRTNGPCQRGQVVTVHVVTGVSVSSIHAAPFSSV